MPVVLDYDGDGNVIGGHTVDQLPTHAQYQAPPQVSDPFTGPALQQFRQQPAESEEYAYRAVGPPPILRYLAPSVLQKNSRPSTPVYPSVSQVSSQQQNLFQQQTVSEERGIMRAGADTPQASRNSTPAPMGTPGLPSNQYAMQPAESQQALLPPQRDCQDSPAHSFPAMHTPRLGMQQVVQKSIDVMDEQKQRIEAHHAQLNQQMQQAPTPSMQNASLPSQYLQQAAHDGAMGPPTMPRAMRTLQSSTAQNATNVQDPYDSRTPFMLRKFGEQNHRNGQSPAPQSSPLVHAVRGYVQHLGPQHLNHDQQRVFNGTHMYGHQQMPPSSPASMTINPAATSLLNYGNPYGANVSANTSLYGNPWAQQQGAQLGPGAYTQELQTYLNQRNVGMPQSTYQAYPAQTPQSTASALAVPSSFLGHRHSHPSAVLSYGPNPPPPTSGGLAPSSLRHSMLASAAASPEPQTTVINSTNHQRPTGQQYAPASAARSQHDGRVDSPQDQSRNQLIGPIPNLAMHNFIHDVKVTFADYPPAMNAFGALCDNFRERRITDERFYIGLYGLLYRTGAAQLRERFKVFAPQRWQGRDLAWFHRSVEQQLDDELEVQVQERLVREAQAGAGTQQSVQRTRGGEATRKHRRAPSESHEAPKQKVVKLRVSTEALQKMKDINACSTDDSSSEKEEKAPAQKKRSKAPARMPQKKVPKRGFRAGQGDVGPAPAPKPKTRAKKQEPSTMAIRNAKEATPAGSSPLSSLSSSPDNAPPRPATFVPEPEPQNNKSKKPNYANTPAAQVPHFGPVFATRRAVLARDSRPYIHLACGQGFTHPQDVKGHHAGDSRYGRACAGQKKKTVSKKAAEWDAHESCKVGYKNIRYTKVQDGFVILDRESWEKLERVNGIGRRFLKGKRGKGVKGGKSSGEAEDGWDDEEEGSEADAEGEEMDGVVELGEVGVSEEHAETDPANESVEDLVMTHMSKVLSSSPPAPTLSPPKTRAKTTTSKKASPAKRKVFTAGSDETPTQQLLPKRKVVIAGPDETQQPPPPKRQYVKAGAD